MPYLRENQVSKLRTLEEIEKASDDFHPRMDMDPIMDILKEADEKLITVKSTKKEGTKGKNSKVLTKTKSKSKKEIKTEENEDKNQPYKDQHAEDKNSKTKNKPKKGSKAKRGRATKPKKAKNVRGKNKISQRITDALRLHKINTFSDDKMLQVIWLTDKISFH